MHSFPKLDKFTFPSLLKSCAALPNLKYGRTIHAKIIEMGLQTDSYIASALINMYVKSGSFSDSINAFCKFSDNGNSNTDVTLWNTMINGYFQFGFVSEAFSSFCQMQTLAVRPDGYSLSIVLGACSTHSNLQFGKQIHAYVFRNYFEKDSFLGTSLIEMYSKCMRPLNAFHVFDSIFDRSIFVWSSMIGGLCRNGLWEKSLELFLLMKSGCKEVGSAIFSSVLTACSFGEVVFFGKRIHCEIIKMGLEHDPYVCTALLTMYSKCILVEDSYKVFSEIPDKRIELWNAMISAYVGNNYIEEALGVYGLMRFSGLIPDSFTISNILAACSSLVLHDFGRRVHAEMLKTPAESDMAVQSSLLTMYAKCGQIEEAKSVFNMINHRDLITWGSMIMGLCQNNKILEALDLFKAMELEGLKPDSEIIVSVIGACGGLEDMELGSQIHGVVVKSGVGSDIFVSCALIDMYSKCGLPEIAETVFSGMTNKSLVACNSIISTYSRNGHPILSISLFAQILQHGLVPDSVSLTSVLVAISSLAALVKCKMMHAIQIRYGLLADFHVNNSLIDVYIKCGSLEYARRVFNTMLERDTVTWNIMISGYGSHGQCLEAIRLFEEMQRLEVSPDEVTFLGLISSCTHSGLVEEGVTFFQSMRTDYGITPQMEHFANMVDLWGRAGCLSEAYDFIQNMPIKPDESVWLCLLYACGAHRQIELGELAANQLLKLDTKRSGNYVELLNLYGEAGLWEKSANVRTVMKERGVKKNPGCSWIEVKDKSAVFFAADFSSPHTEEMFATLKKLKRNMEADNQSCHEENELMICH